MEKRFHFYPIMDQDMTPMPAEGGAEGEEKKMDETQEEGGGAEGA